jgi:O-acetyl-ADP-ribose deacetylase (regulator of RNase III)
MSEFVQIAAFLTRFFTTAIVPVAGKLLKFTIPRIARLPKYIRLLQTIYTDQEANSESRKYLTSVLLVLGSILTFLTWSYVPMVGVPIIGAFMTPIAAVIALILSLIALEATFGLNQQYFAKKYPQEFNLVKLDIEEISGTLGESWEEMIVQTQALLNSVKQQLDPDRKYDDSITASVNALISYLWVPQDSKSLPPSEISRRIVTEGLPPLAKYGGSAAEGILAGSMVAHTTQSIASGIFTKAGAFTTLAKLMGLQSGIIVSGKVYALLTVMAPLSLAAITGLGLGYGVNTLRTKEEERKLSKFLADALIAALPIVWVDGDFSSEGRDVVEKMLLNSAINDKDRRRIRSAVNDRASFEDVLHLGVLQEKNPLKAKMKNRLLLCTAYELAKADNHISEKEMELHNRMAKFTNIQEEEILEIRRLILLNSGIDSGARIKVVQGDILEQSVDAIVVSANKNLLPKKWSFATRRGIDLKVHQLAGAALREECKGLGVCSVGEARITKGYNLISPWVIHTVTPSWNDGNWEEQESLRQCYRNTLKIAHQRSLRSVAFPALGTKSGKVPIQESARIAISEARSFLNTHFNVEQLVFVCWDEQTYEAFTKAAQEDTSLLGQLDSSEPESQSIPMPEFKDCVAA